MDYFRNASYSVGQTLQHLLRPIGDVFAVVLDSNESLVSMFQLQNGVSPLERYARAAYISPNGHIHYTQEGITPHKPDIRWSGFNPMIDAKKRRHPNRYYGHKTQIARALYKERQKNHKKPVVISNVNRRLRQTTLRVIRHRKHGSLFQ